jgi:DnaJ family protein B protein 4
MSDYYKILGVDKTATTEEIKKSYRKLALKWHPDKHKEKSKIDDAQKKFQEISQAYSTLSDPEKRKKYDMFGTDAENMPTGGFGGPTGPTGKVRFHSSSGIPSGFVNADDIFKHFFGTSNVHEAEDDRMGNFQHFSFSGTRPGPRNFSHTKAHEPVKKTIEKDLNCTLEDLYTGTIKSVTIDGKTENISINPGTKAGTKFTYDHQFENIILILTVKEIPHAKLTRIDNDLCTTLKISLKEALEGFTRCVTLFDGKFETVRLKSIPSSDYIHRAKSGGMPIRKKGELIGKGDLLVNFIVDFSH